MFVYLILDGSCKRIPSLSVDLEKCAPRAGIYKGGKLSLTLLYKVLVLDSILVDCDRKRVYWSCEQCDMDMIYRASSQGELYAENVLDYFGNKEKLSKEEELLKNESLDKMFEKAESIFHNASPESFESEGNEYTYGSLLEILQMYILPEITFQSKHRKLVQQCLDTIKKESQYIEMLIQMSVQTLSNLEELLVKQRKCLLLRESVSTILNTVPRDVDFIRLLLKHADEDIKKLEGILILLTEKEKKVGHSTDEARLKLLVETRKERDKISNEKETIISAAENLLEGISKENVTTKRKTKSGKLRLSKSHVDKPVSLSDKYEKYKKDAAEIETLSNEIKQQINIKIRLSTVRQSVISALKYL
ncbi:uncharacterized protein LOC123563059 [Mercenaria mercenaria]|uniref:uncharacterized protein LOC123563059 n=1 Tax=Mercenaria mercenaria TaxID=6596 RepID=UPI00234E5981|nr:uncharacterized protein LOC123563059 [Mercenaria mercenaria]